jgi:hypothetical protein
MTNAELIAALQTDIREVEDNPVNTLRLMWRAADALEADEQRIEKLEKQLPKWVSVEDKLPEESGEYIVYIQMGTGVEVPDFFGSNDLSYVTSMYFKERQKLWLDEYDEAYNADLSLVDTANDYHITHWMPLPQKPKGEHDD